MDNNNKPTKIKLPKLLCLANLHSWEQNYDSMYDEHTRTCNRCDKVQYARVIILEIKWQDEKIKRNTYTKQF